MSSEARRRQLETAGEAADENFSSADSGGGAAECRETDWLLIELRDAEGRPVAGARYVVELPDGSRVEGTLGDDGIAGVEGIDPGKCVVTFPDIPADDRDRTNSGDQGSAA